MPRQSRIEYAGAYYHVMARGNRREAIVRDDKDRKLFLKTLEEACARTGWKIHAWILMGNHYHWVLETPEANLVAGMKWFQNTYTRRFNVRHKFWGHLFGGRYKAIVVEPPQESKEDVQLYLGTLIDYIHLNPVRARQVKLGQGKGLLDYPWSSLVQAYALPASQRASWIEVKTGLGTRKLADTSSGRKRYVQILEDIARQESASKCGYREIEGQTLNRTLERGWYWGSQAFREKLFKLSKKPSNRNYRSSPQGKAQASKEAEEWIAEGKKHFGVNEEDLKSTPGSFGPKVALAWALHVRTSASQKWIAERLHMKSAANVSQQVRRWEQQEQGNKNKVWKRLVKIC